MRLVALRTFHDGFTKGPTYFSHGQSVVIAIDGRYPIINPTTFVGGVIYDFKTYVHFLRNNTSNEAAVKFKAVWDGQWNTT